MPAATPALEVACVPALDDNYVWLIHDLASRETVAVDPPECGPVLDALRERGWALTQIWNTHWHPDHTGGNAALKAATGCRIVGPVAVAQPIPQLDRAVGEGDSVAVGAHAARVMAIPAHTADHIAFHLAGAAMIFVGDTLFAMGCGRLFEGTAAQMFDNMRRFEALPDDTRVYCAHEYTLLNGRYAAHADPQSTATAARLAEVERLRAAGIATVPTTIGLEKATNPFMRASSVDSLARHRVARNEFRA